MSTNAILCVDDEAIILMSLKMTLKNHYGDRFQYEGAISAEAALSTMEALIQQGVTILLIVSDWLMPGLKGDEFLKVIHSKYPEIKAIMVSGHVPEDSVMQLEQNHILSGFLTKPVANDKLYAMIDTILEKPVPAAPPSLQS